MSGPLKSGGSIPPESPIVDANQALALLDAMHFWGCKRIERDGIPGYEVRIKHAGRFVYGYGREWLFAVQDAFAKLHGKKRARAKRDGNGPTLRLVGSGE